jgi:hypothetical protein
MRRGRGFALPERSEAVAARSDVFQNVPERHVRDSDSGEAIKSFHELGAFHFAQSAREYLKKLPEAAD